MSKMYYRVYDVEDGSGEARQVLFCGDNDKDGFPVKHSTYLGTIEIVGKNDVVDFLPRLLGEMIENDLLEIAGEESCEVDE